MCSANKIQKCFQLIFLASGSCWNLLHPPQPHSDRDWSKAGFLLFSFPWAKTNIMTTPGPAATWMSHIMGYLPRWDLMHSAPHNVKYLACRSNNFVLQQPSQMQEEKLFKSLLKKIWRGSHLDKSKQQESHSQRYWAVHHRVQRRGQAGLVLLQVTMVKVVLLSKGFKCWFSMFVLFEFGSLMATQQIVVNNRNVANIANKDYLLKHIGISSIRGV